MENSKVELKKRKIHNGTRLTIKKVGIWAFLSPEILKGAFVRYKVILSIINIFRSQILHILLKYGAEKLKKNIKMYLCSPRNHGWITRVAPLILNLDTR
jgi:hypothetical protein